MDFHFATALLKGNDKVPKIDLVGKNILCILCVTVYRNEEQRRLVKNIDKNREKTEAVVQRCSAKKVFLENLQNSQENTCARVSF